MTVSTNDSFACWATGSIAALIKTTNDTLVVR